MGFGLVRAGEDAARTGDELLEPGRNRSAQMAERPLEDVVPFQPPVGADRGGGEICHPQVGGVGVQGRAILAEQPAELAERLEVTAVGESRYAERPPGADGYQPAFGRMLRAPGVRGTSGGTLTVLGWAYIDTGRWDEALEVAAEAASTAEANLMELVAAPGVDVGPPEHGQGPAAGAPYAGGPEPLHGVLQQADRQVGFVQEPGGGRYSPQRGLLDGRAGDRAQVREKLVSAADRVGADAYPESQHVDISAPIPAGARRTLAFQQVEGTADGLAAGGQAGLVGDRGRTPERVPGEVRLVT